MENNKEKLVEEERRFVKEDKRRENQGKGRDDK